MKRQYTVQQAFVRIIGENGFTLMPIILIIMLFTALITAGVLLIEPMAKRGKVVNTQKTVDSALSSIIGWSVANNRIPDLSTASTGFAAVTGNINDTFGKPLIYIPADNFLNPAPSGICNRRTTNLRVSSITDDIALVVLSGGDDYTVNSTPNTSQVLNGTLAVSSNDLVKWVTLEELKNKAGCYGSAQGRLKILNNELPAACIGQSYNATMYGNGGVLPYGNWTSSTLPAGLAFNAASGHITGTPSVSAGTYNITFSINDSDNDSVQKTLPLRVISCSASPACTLTANPTEILKGGRSTLAWIVTNGPANGSFSPSSGTCSTFSGSTGGSCRTARLTMSAQTGFTLTVTNTDGTDNCSASVYTAYRVWNNTGARRDFMVDGICRRVNSNSEITANPLLLSYGQTIDRYSSNNRTCNGAVVAQLNYATAAAADLNGNSRVSFTGTDR